MKFALIATLSVILGCFSQAAVSQMTPVPPPIISVGKPAAISSERPSLLGWIAGPVTCDGAVQTVRIMVPVSNSLAWLPSDSQALKPISFSFRIDVEGRPLSIVRTEPRFAAWSDDVGPAFAAMRFASGAGRRGCNVTFTPRHWTLAEAPIELLYSYAIFPGGIRLPREAVDRLKPAGSDCIDPPPALRARAFPDFKPIVVTPGTRDWTMTGYDIDRTGKPVRVHIVATTGNAALDRAAVAASQASRFEPGERHGCLYPYWRAAETTLSPAIPDTAPRNEPAKCPVEKGWANPLNMQFPPNYLRRGIEGWAILSYDVAPWGAIGNISVLASEPTDQFGQSATQMLQTARKASSDRGYVGCISRVRYAIPKPGTPHRDNPDDDSVPPPF